MNRILMTKDSYGNKIQTNLWLPLKSNNMNNRTIVGSLLILCIFMFFIRYQINRVVNHDNIENNGELSEAKSVFASNTDTKSVGEKHSKNNYLAKALAGDKKGKSVVEKYIERFKKIAIQEQEIYGVPASISLAQAILESNCGDSKLASDNNNHFGIKCIEKNCDKGHCVIYEDDTPKDRFKNYNTAWESWRDHSLFLQRSRYQYLARVAKDDYKAYAKGLKEAGYATDKKYDKKLIKIIEKFELDKIR